MSKPCGLDGCPYPLASVNCARFHAGYPPQDSVETVRAVQAALGCPGRKHPVSGKRWRPSRHKSHGKTCPCCGKTISNKSEGCNAYAARKRWCNGHLRSEAYIRAFKKGRIKPHGGRGKYQGVHYLEASHRWFAFYKDRSDGTIPLGIHDTPEEAARANDRYRLYRFGDKALPYLNFPDET